MKHFNLGVVIGIVTDVRKRKSVTGNPYLHIEINCFNVKYGSVTTFGRLWGNDKVREFLDYWKANRRSAFKFHGIFQQYEKNGARHTNYTFWKWSPHETTELRATFVLKGEAIKNGPTIFLYLKREKNPAEDFELHLMPQLIQNCPDGPVEVEGLLRAREPEDYYGRPSDDIRPYVMKLKALKDG